MRGRALSLAAASRPRTPSRGSSSAGDCGAAMTRCDWCRGNRQRSVLRVWRFPRPPPPVLCRRTPLLGDAVGPARIGPRARRAVLPAQTGSRGSDVSPSPGVPAHGAVQARPGAGRSACQLRRRIARCDPAAGRAAALGTSEPDRRTLSAAGRRQARYAIGAQRVGARAASGRFA